MLEVMAGYDKYDITSVEHAKEEYVAALGQPVSGLRLGLPAGYFDDLDPEVAAAVEAATALLAKLTRGVRDCALPGVSHLGNLGSLGETLAWHEPYFKNQPTKYMLNERRRLQSISEAKPLATEYIRARWEIETVRRHIDDAFKDFDLVVTPTQRILAPTLNELITRANENKTTNPRTTSNTQPFDVYGVPSISIPCGFSRSGLPIGLMISGPRFAEGKVLALAQAYEAATDWHLRKPPLGPQTAKPEVTPYA
jgi:aspartyl-tRNA(Asn)/glutamyl-tRNA(Gln) amidotransferase subunit A